MAGKFTDQELFEYWQAFSVFDENGDGTISTSELRHVMKSLGQNLTRSEIQSMMNEIDSDGSGTVDFDEFLSLIIPTQTDDNCRDPQSDLLKAFEAFDTNGDGFVSRKELKEGLEVLGEKLSEIELNELITKIDSDNSGRIEYKEFLKLMNLQ